MEGKTVRLFPWQTLLLALAHRKKRIRKSVFRSVRTVFNFLGYDIRKTAIQNFEISASGRQTEVDAVRSENSRPAKSPPEVVLVYLSVGNEGLELLENSVASARNVGFRGKIQEFHLATEVSTLEAFALIYDLDLEEIDSQRPVELRGVQNFGEGDFALITHLKWDAILRALDDDHKVVIFVDSDVVFIRAFEKYFLSASSYYMAGIQSESRAFFPPAFCIGLMFFTSRARSLLTQISAATDSNAARGTAQQILNELVLANPELIFNILTLPEAVFPVGLSYSLVKGPPHPLQVHTPEVVAFHANWVLGNEGKRKMLASLGLWNV